ncbi:MAG: chemotaxis protein CheA [bacterium]|nr:chemotaxis protein CheA [bacterium]
MSNLRDVYLEEAEELFKRIEEALLLLENSPEDSSSLIADVFRSMHTLKGNSGMFGLTKVADFLHNLETLYEKVRSDHSLLSEDIIECTFKSLDHVKKIIYDPEIEEQENIDENQALTDEILKILKRTEEVSIDLHSIEALSGMVSYLVFFQPKHDVFEDGTNPILLLDELAELGKSKVFSHMESKALSDSFDPKVCYTSWNIVLVTEKGLDAIRDVFIFVEDSAMIEINELFDGDILADQEFHERLPEVDLPSAPLSFDDFRSLIEIDRPSASGDTEIEVIPETTDSSTEEKTEKTESTPEPATKKAPVETKKTSTSTSSSEEPSVYKNKVKKLFDKNKTASSIRVSSDKLNELMNNVSELVTTQAALALFTKNNFDPTLDAISDNVEKLTRQLRDISFGMTLVQVDNLFSRFQRVIRDLSSQLGKSVRFVTEGGDTELDKTIIENLADPLMHIIRNSLDHGIETAEERVKNGKPETGTIKLMSYYSGAKVYIRVEDDGGGMDPEKIRKKALEKKLISKDDNLSEKETFDLIFAPGFSTAANVTDVSGRGVGMDVVRKNILDLRGDIQVESELGVGTSITLGLPLTLSVIDGLLIKVKGTHFIIPLAEISKCFELDRKEISNEFNSVIVLDDEQLPYLDLRKEFNLGMEDNPEVTSVIVVHKLGTKIGVCVDSIEGEYQAVLKPVGKYYRDQEFISGATILGDGSLALVLDAYKIVERKMSKQKVTA